MSVCVCVCFWLEKNGNEEGVVIGGAKIQSHGDRTPHVPSSYTTHLSIACSPENTISQGHLHWVVTQVTLAVLKAGRRGSVILCLRGHFRHLVGAGHAHSG